MSLFASVHGKAKKVYSVEAADVSEYQELIIKDNKIENIILLKGRIEDVHIPEMVDIIISEWMGFYLLHEV